MPSISKKYSRKRNNRKRGHSRRHASYNRRRNMFGGEGGTYEVEPFNAGNDSDTGNLKALNTLKSLDYVDDRGLTTGKFDLLNTLSNTPKQIFLPDTDISLRKNQAIWGGMVVAVNDIKDGSFIGQVTFTKRLPGQ